MQRCFEKKVTAACTRTDCMSLHVNYNIKTHITHAAQTDMYTESSDCTQLITDRRGWDGDVNSGYMCHMVGTTRAEMRGHKGWRIRGVESLAGTPRR